MTCEHKSFVILGCDCLHSCSTWKRIAGEVEKCDCETSQHWKRIQQDLWPTSKSVETVSTVIRGTVHALVLQIRILLNEVVLTQSKKTQTNETFRLGTWVISKKCDFL